QVTGQVTAFRVLRFSGCFRSVTVRPLSMASSSSQPVQRNPDRTRRRILQAAIRLFATHGFHAVSVDQIVGKARVNKRMVYHYFGSKDALFEAALSEVYKRIAELEFHAVERGRSPREKLSRLLE